MEFNQELLNPGTQIEDSSPLFKSLDNNLSLVLSQMKSRLADVSSSHKFDFKLNEFRIGEKERFIGAMVTQFTNKGEVEKNSMTHLVNNVNDFLVCLKSDGIRYLVAITNKGGVYFLDRMNNIFEVQTDVSPLISDPNTSEDLKIDYILDGELIFNQTGLAPHERLHFHLFDCLLFKRSLVIDRNYMERMECCQLFISYNQFYQKLSASSKKQYGPQTIYIYVKDFYVARSTEFLLKKMSEIPAFKDKIDGLIFTKINYPYYPGRNQGIIKWKPDYLNTIDFLVVESQYFARHSPDMFQGDDFFVFELYCGYSGALMLFDYLFVFDVDKYIDIKKEFKVIKTADYVVEGAILECQYDKTLRHEKMEKFYGTYYEMDFELIQNLIQRSELGGKLSNDSGAINALLGSLEKRRSETDDILRGNWVGLRVRSDKSFPNGFITAKNVFNSIFEDNVSEQLLLRKIQEGYEKQANVKGKRVKQN